MRWRERWSPETRRNHEGYVAGYFIESTINHYTLTGGRDTRLYDAAKKLADCWVANIGPGKKEWYDGHQEMEQALVRFGLIFFRYKMNLAYHDAKYADLYEETIYNALMGSIDFEGKHLFYTNPLSSSDMRDSWHVCPCCVGNIPRTLLMIPTWTYVKSDDGIYVNLFIGSTVNVEKVSGTDIEMVQKTDYPWKYS